MSVGYYNYPTRLLIIHMCGQRNGYLTTVFDFDLNIQIKSNYMARANRNAIYPEDDNGLINK